MSHSPGPWDLPEPATPPPPPRRRISWVWLGLAAALVALVVALVHAFPEALQTQQDWFDVALRSGFVLLVAAGLLRLRRDRWRQHLGHAAIWVAVIAVLALGFAYRDELLAVPKRVAVVFSNEPVATAPRELTVTADESGAFTLVGRLNGERVRFMIDTGASEIVISPEDAKRLGIDASHLRFDSPAGTANGVVYGARYTVDRLEVGSIVLDKVPVVINPTPMGVSLLGMTFLQRMEAVQLHGHTLTLKAP